MPGVLRKLAEHRIDLNEGSKPIKQWLRHFSPDKKAAIKKEITKLLVAGFIQEILHPNWLANPMLVQKDSNEWRMCVDYMDLNKHCPKDMFGLPRIDQILIRQLGQLFYLCLIATQGIIRSRFAWRTRAKHLLSLRLVLLLQDHVVWTQER
jgi:hypothetical protein